MTKLSARTTIAKASMAKTIEQHLMIPGGPTSWKAPISYYVPHYGTNIIYVSETGDNDIAAVMPHMPFLTIAAARTYALTLTPSATSRVLIKLMPGTWTETIYLDNYIDYDTTNCILQSGGAWCIIDNGVSCNSIVYGNAKITSSSAAPIVISHAGSSVYIECDSITFTGTASTVISSGSLTLNVNQTITSSSTAYAFDFASSGTSTVSARNIVLTGASAVNAPILCGGTHTLNLFVKNKITFAATAPILCLSSSQFIINSTKIEATGVNADVVKQTAGYLILRNCILSTNGTGKCISDNSLVYITGHVDTNADIGAGVFTIGGTLNQLLEII